MSSTANINFSEGEFFAVRAAADILRDKKRKSFFRARAAGIFRSAVVSQLFLF